MKLGLAGLTYIDEKIDDIEMNYAFSGKFRGKGYGVGIATGLVKFAFEQLNLDKLDGETLSYNSASQYLLRKIGMQSEDIKSSSNFKDTYSNVYSITKDQYECHVHKNNRVLTSMREITMLGYQNEQRFKQL